MGAGGRRGESLDCRRGGPPPWERTTAMGFGLVWAATWRKPAGGGEEAGKSARRAEETPTPAHHAGGSHARVA
jgi:hypothetical protein